MYRRRKVVREKKPEIPDTLEGFGYVLKENGEIRSKTTDEPYVFEYLPKDRTYNEQRYKAFINLIGEEVEKKLVEEPFNFQKKIIPVDADPAKDPHSYIYMTPNALTTTDKLILFISGNNTRIGQWSRRVMCDENIYTGSVMDTTRRVREKGYEVIIFNPNGNYWYKNRAWEYPEPHSVNITLVPGSEGPEEHCRYVFDHFIRHAKAQKLAALTLDWGGHALTQALDVNFDEYKDRFICTAMANSVHSRDMIKDTSLRTWLFDNCVNWTVSQKEKGGIITDPRFGCTCISSNQEIADFTLTECIDDIMNFIFVKMGDIEPETKDDEDEFENDVTEEQLEELKEHLEITSIQ
ncbi:hypothetical protein RMCBS344292_08986 [Rhizopus microsporus]|uniref:Arb2 domain-containing protein n=1 Tax=Rhizopus microsporus TaxID=58291 RepID=A0A0A1NQA3_RHIZD|nr:hypothetical protein BCV71DRAFT_224325 [Rhizopus microsporus]CEI94781.1 hypothetical protein RMCBS344292_08986 [Rhizopus microsporus]